MACCFQPPLVSSLILVLGAANPTEAPKFALVLASQLSLEWAALFGAEKLRPTGHQDEAQK